MAGTPITGKGGNITLTNAAGITPVFTITPEVVTYSYENSAEVIKGSRLSGPPFKAAGDIDYTGSITIYASKSTGAALPFKAGDDVNMTASFGNNTLSGQILVKSIAPPEVSKGKFAEIKIDWEQNDANFTDTVKIVTL
jgi:hypothetical protein